MIENSSMGTTVNVNVKALRATLRCLRCRTNVNFGRILCEECLDKVQGRFNTEVIATIRSWLEQCNQDLVWIPIQLINKDEKTGKPIGPFYVHGCIGKIVAKFPKKDQNLCLKHQPVARPGTYVDSGKGYIGESNLMGVKYKLEKAEPLEDEKGSKAGSRGRISPTDDDQIISYGQRVPKWKVDGRLKNIFKAQQRALRIAIEDEYARWHFSFAQGGEKGATLTTTAIVVESSVGSSLSKSDSQGESGDKVNSELLKQAVLSSKALGEPVK